MGAGGTDWSSRKDSSMFFSVVGVRVAVVRVGMPEVRPPKPENCAEGKKKEQLRSVKICATALLVIGSTWVLPLLRLF